MKKIISLLGASLLFVGSISTSIVLSNHEKASKVLAVAPETTYTTGDAATYYNGISDDSTGSSLLSALQSLNNRKRETRVGYDSMGTSASGQFKYTDYDPSTVIYDNNGQPYGTKISSFYTYTPATSFNREHVWPNSHGGGKNGSLSSPFVDSDIHVTRPTISSENSSRGNSYFVDGMNHPSDGWDPYTAGYNINSRGEAARIIFYCVVADSRLEIEDKNSSYTPNNKMGNINTLIKWHLDHAITDREINRNEGAEYLQGNRNPFIDHPEYVCRIWGNTNDTTRELCSRDPYGKEAPTAITINKDSASIKMYETLQLSVTSVTPADADQNINWSSSNSSIATVSTTGLVTGKAVGTATITASALRDSNVKATCTITVSEPDNVAMTDASVTPASISLRKGARSQINVTTTPSFVYPVPTINYVSNDVNVARVDGTGSVTGVAAGETTISVTVTQGEVVINKSIPVTVTASSGDDYNLVTSLSDLANDDKVVLAINLEGENGVSGLQDGSSNASVSTDKASWKKYVVKNVSASSFNLYDEEAEQYIATPTSNTYQYSDTEPAALTVDGDGRLLCGDRYLAANPDGYYRFYLTSKDFAPFHVYRLGGDDPDTPVDPTVYVTGITLNKTNAELKIGMTLQLEATITPDDATNKSVTWSSENEAIATVTASGMVFAESSGTTRITVTTVDGSFSASCTVVVTDESSGGGDSGQGGGEQGGGGQGGGDVNVKVTCGGNIVATSVILSTISLLGVVLLLTRKHKEN